MCDIEFACIVCGNYCHNQQYYDTQYDDETNWMNKLVMLLKTNKIVHNIVQSACNMEFDDDIEKKRYTYDPGDFTYICGSKCEFDESIIKRNTGTFIHTDCWNFIKNEYGLELKYSDLPYKLGKYTVITDDMTVAPHDKIDYGEISNYYDYSHIEYDRMMDDGNTWMMTSPLSKNEKNVKRIKKIIKQLIRTDPNRKSPLSSATFYDDGDIKIGKNNKLWVIKNGKWVKIDKETIIKSINFNTYDTNNDVVMMIYDLPLVGEDNQNPIFIMDYDYNKESGDVILELIGTQQEIDKIVSQLNNQNGGQHYEYKIKYIKYLSKNNKIVDDINTLQ